MALENDQASSLRNAVRERQAGLSRKSVRCFAVASGKGGVGKTFLCVNLAVALGQLGRKVLIIDADLGLANADLVLGVSPEFSLQDAVFKNKSFEEIVAKTPYNVDLLAASSGAREMVSMGQARLKMLIDDLIGFASNYDVLIFDCAAGIDSNVTSFLAAVPQTLLVATPQPASIMDAYALTKVVHQENLSKHLSLVVNMAASDQEGERVRNILNRVSESYLSRKLELLGVIPESRGAIKAIYSRKPLVVVAPDDPAARRLLDIAKKIIVSRDAETKLGDLDSQRLVNGLMKI